eukprot:8835512-Pyramimonas_sp.AAC.1
MPQVPHKLLLPEHHNLWRGIRATASSRSRKHVLADLRSRSGVHYLCRWSGQATPGIRPDQIFSAEEAAASLALAFPVPVQPEELIGRMYLQCHSSGKTAKRPDDFVSSH